MTDKIKIQTNTLTRITALIWRAILATAWQIYSAVIRSVMVYGAAVWHSHLDGGGMAMTCGWCSEGPVQKLSKIQNKYLWIVAGAYKAILIAVFETETHISFLDLHLNARLAVFRQQHKNLNMKSLMRKACKKMKTHL